MQEVLDALACVKTLQRLDFAAVRAAHGDYVWLTLQRFGVPAADLDDAFQEVFIVVLRRLPDFDGSCEPTTWLYGICRRVAASTRRKAYRRHETPVGQIPEEIPDPSPDPADDAAARQAEEQLGRILDAMDLDLRAAFVMFEIDGLSCSQIAHLSGVAVGTVYARLHAARNELARILERMNAAEARRSRR